MLISLRDMADDCCVLINVENIKKVKAATIDSSNACCTIELFDGSVIFAQESFDFVRQMIETMKPKPQSGGPDARFERELGDTC